MVSYRSIKYGKTGVVAERYVELYKLYYELGDPVLANCYNH